MRKVVTVEDIKAGAELVVEAGLVRTFIKGVDRPDRIACSAREDIPKGAVGVIDFGSRQLRLDKTGGRLR